MTVTHAASMRTRSDLYGWLAAALHVPDEVVIGAEFAEAGQTLWRELFPGNPSAALEALERENRETAGSRALNSQTTGSSATIASRLDQVKREYARLFLGPPHALVHPYESCYFGEDRLMTARTVAVGTFLRTWGVVPDPGGVPEPVDHIAVELEFLAIVCAGDARTPAPDPWEIEDRFLREHLGQWGRLVAYDIRAATEEPLYVAAAEMLERIVERMLDQPA